MKKLLIISAVILVMTSCQSGEKSANTGTQYFRQLKFTETSYDIHTGMHSITADQSKDINHYKFTYDDQGRLINLDYCRGDVLLDESSTGAPRIVISYEGNKEIHHFFDIDGEPTGNGDYFSEEYELDAEGKRMNMRFYDEEGNQVENDNGIAWYDWEILANDQLKENRYNMEGEEMIMNEFCPFYELRFNYDEQGYMTMMANYQGDTMYNCTVENCGDIGVSYFRFNYNDAGDLTDFTVESLNGQLSNLYWGWARFENKYDKNGNMIEQASFDQDDEPVGGMSIPVTQMVYDEHGAVIERKYMDINRQLMNHPRSGVAVEKYTYDELGRPEETLQFDAGMSAL